MTPGQLVRVNGRHWYGEIVDVAISNKRIMLLISSPKGIWRNHGPEWLEYIPEQIKPATTIAAIENAENYVQRIEKNLADAQAMQKRWAQSNE